MSTATQQVMKPEIEIEGAQLTETGLILQDGLSFEDWEAIGHQLGRYAQGVMWWIGDWLNYGEHAYGETYAQAIDITGYKYNTVKQAKYVAGKFPSTVRTHRLTFSHYAEVAGEEFDRAAELLKTASKKSMTVEELRVERKGEKSEKKKKVKEVTNTIAASMTCPDCGCKFEAEIDL